MVDLDQTVEEVKEEVRSAEDPDLEDLLEQEKQGKDRKTIKEFLDNRIESERQEKEEEVEEELVEEIEEETEGGLLSGFTRSQLVTGGAMMGVILGLVVGALAFPMQEGIGASQAEDRVQQLIEAGGQDLQNLDISSENRNGMYYLTVAADQPTQNGTQTATQTYYMTRDGVLLFPEVIQGPLGAQNVAINIDEALQQAQNQQPEVNETQGDTTQ